VHVRAGHGARLPIDLTMETEGYRIGPKAFAVGVMRKILDQPSVGASEYSGCKPPRIGFARTSASDAKR
jgi:hypothetical protein